MKKLGVLFVWLSLAVGGFGAEGPCVAVSVTGANSERWQGVLTAELSKAPGMRIVERVEYARLLREREVAVLRNAGERQLPPLPSIAYYLHFRQIADNDFLVEIVAADNGELLASTSVKNARLDAAGELADAARNLLKTAGAKADGKRVPRVAVIEPTGELAGERVFILGARLRDALAAGGFTVLDRALTQEVVIERNDAERGMRDTVPDNAFLGADYFLRLVPAGDGRCELRLVKVANGQLVAARTFAVDGPASVNQIQSWLFPLLGVAEKNVQPYLPSVSVEALQPFYRGLKLYDEGKFAEATNEFARAYILDRQFEAAYEWEARCYDALTMPQLGDALRRYAKVYMDYSVSTNAETPAVSDAISFLGVSGDFPELRAKLSALAANALSVQGKQAVCLPENLAQICREYDWLAGLAGTDGHRWEQAQSFFCRTAVSGKLTVTDGKPVIRWVLRNTLTGNLISAAELPLLANPKAWPGQIEKFLRGWPAGKHAVAAAPAPAARTNLSAAELADRLQRARGPEINIALLNLALADPGNPLLVSCGFERNDDKRQGVDGFLNNALRDYAIAKLPAGDVRRRWLELMQVYTYIGDNPIGKIYSGQKRDFIALLRDFSAAGGTDIPGLVARYSLLFNTQSRMTYPELIRQCDELLADLKNADAAEFADLRKVTKYTESIRQLARIAAGDTSLEFWLNTGNGDNWQPSPHCIRLKWDRGQKLPALDSFTPWVTNDMQLCSLTPEEKITEAQVAILFNGRGSFTCAIPDEWLEKYPRSLTLTTFLAELGLHDVNWSLGLPIQHRFNGKAEVASYSRQIDYTANNLKFWIGRIDSVRQLDQFENTVYRFVTTLNEPAFLDILSDSEYADVQRQLAGALKEADQRTGRTHWNRQRLQFIKWQTLTREEARQWGYNQLIHFEREVKDRNSYLQRLKGMEAAAVAEPGQFNPKPWWDLLRGDDISLVFTQPEFAEFCRRFHPQTMRMFDSGMFSTGELAYVFEQALMLLYGGSSREAEELFEQIQNVPITDLNRGYTGNLIRANAALRLAQIYRMNRRLPEAVRQAQLGLQLCGEGNFYVIGRWVKDDRYEEKAEQNERGDLARHLVRLLQDLRFDPRHANLPERVGVVTVDTPNMDHPELKIFYRVPAGADADKPCRVLVLTPGYNVDIVSYLQPGGAWARFADEHNLVLVMARFRTISHWAWERTNTYSFYSAAQVWSGKALLDGLDKIGEQRAIQKEKLLFYGYASASGFTLRFTRWRPELVAAVAVGRPSNFGTPRFAEPGLKPMAALKNIAFHIGASEFDDDYCYAFFNRYETAVHFATLLQADDVAVEWKNYPGLTPPSARELEDDAREFLAKQLTGK